MLVSMKQLLYVHARLTPWVMVISRAVNEFVGRQLRPLLGRILPGRKHRHIIALILLLVGLLVQMVLLWLLGELISISISVMELWALLARKHLEITL